MKQLNLLFIIILVLLACKPNNSSVEKENTPLPTLLPAYTIVEEKTDTTYDFARILVQLENEINPDSLQTIALEIKDSIGEYANFRIFYFLSGSLSEKGLWAKTIFQPNIETEIFGRPIPSNTLVSNLPDCSLRKEPNQKPGYEFDVFIGRENQTTEAPFQVNFNGEGLIKYSDLTDKISSFRKRVPEYKRARITARLYIDVDVPHIYLGYLKKYLARSSQLRIQYINKEERGITVRLPPYSEKYCNQPKDPSCKRKNIFEFNHLSLINSNLDATWNPKIYYTDFKGMVTKENFYEVRIDESGKAFINGESVKLDDLMNSCSKRLLEHKEPHKLIFELNTNHSVKYKYYLLAYSQLRYAYNEVWNTYAQELFNKSYDALDRADMKIVKNKYPLIITETIY